MKLMLHCVKSVRARSYSGPHFPSFALNMERYGVSLRIQSKYRKIRSRITPNKDTFHAAFGRTLFMILLTLVVKITFKVGFHLHPLFCIFFLLHLISSFIVCNCLKLRIRSILRRWDLLPLVLV